MLIDATVDLLLSQDRIAFYDEKGLLDDFMSASNRDRVDCVCLSRCAILMLCRDDISLAISLQLQNGLSIFQRMQAILKY